MPFVLFCPSLFSSSSFWRRVELEPRPEKSPTFLSLIVSHTRLNGCQKAHSPFSFSPGCLLGGSCVPRPGLGVRYLAGTAFGWRLKVKAQKWAGEMAPAVKSLQHNCEDLSLIPITYLKNKKAGVELRAVVRCWGRQIQEDPWGSLDSFSRLLAPGQRGTLSQKARWRWTVLGE